MSNDSNEQGNEQGQAFQAGDRVRYRLDIYDDWREGTVLVHMGDMLEVGKSDDNPTFMMRPSECELISRATPAASERIGACLVCEQYRTRAECCRVERDETCVYVCLVCGNAIDESDTGRQRSAASEPATPAPAVRASGAVDTHTLELPVRVTCCRCDGDGVLVLDDEGLTEQCGLCHGVGWTTDTILLSDNAVDRLAAALAPLLVKRMVHDIRMIANDRP